MLNETAAEWTEMDDPVQVRPAPVRLLCVEGNGLAADELLESATALGIEVMSLARSLDDALRQAFMGFPGIVVVPYVGDQVLDFLRALDCMRSSSFSPYVVLITDADHGAVLEKCAAFYRVSVLPLARVSQQLLPHLLRIAREIAPDA